ncbi:hypothetical protein [Ferrimonas sp. YFM]|uniref:hypothetical protein n=1 Tax=Ferrimonas sp. YFM TaxID=3028878 RepID=UPI002572FEF8|nr:hypothetical protein [Ferrimonas sp. YFM]BDY05009.1 hypothetical protein F0521_20500 [Ferrimonas sp. YFM]
MQTAISILVFAMMLVVGSGLVTERQDLKMRTGKTAALVGAQLLLPLLVLLIGGLMGMAEPLLLALVVIALCPGGTVSNFYTHLAKGAVLLSVTLTTLSGLLFVALAILASLVLSPIDSALAFTATGQLLFFLLAPLLLGVAAARQYPAWAGKVRPYLEFAIGIGLIVVVAKLIIDHHGLARDWGVQMWLGCTLFTLGAMGLGKLTAVTAGLNRDESVAVVVEFPCRNLALATYLALILGLAQEVVLMTAICFCTQLPLLGAYVASKRRLIS